MNHLTPDEIVDAVEQTLAEQRAGHLAACSECHEKVAHASAVLRETRAVEIPEPSPLFWAHLSDRVRIAIGAEQAPAASRMRHWLQWPVLVPLAGIALVVLALMSAVPRGELTMKAVDSVVVANVAGWSDDEAALAADAGWDVVSNLVGPLDFDTAQQAGIATAPGAADQAALQLTAVEQQELARLVQQELGWTGS